MARKRVKGRALEVVKMIRIVIVTSEGRTTATIKAPDATLRMRDAARRAIIAMMDPR